MKCVLSDCSNIDVAMLLDTSVSVQPDWSRQNGVQDLLRKFINRFSIGSNMVRLSTQVFGDAGYVNWVLNTYYDKSTMLSQVGPLMYFRGGELTYYDQALVTAANTQFQPANGDRASAQNVIIMVTDGTTSTENRFSVRQAAENLRNTGATIYVIGYGNNLNRDILTDITGDANKVITYPSIDNANAAFEQLYQRLCPFTAPTPAPVTPAPVTPAPVTPSPITPGPGMHLNSSLTALLH